MRNRAVILVLVVCIALAILVDECRGKAVVDQLQCILDLSFMIHGALIGAYLLRRQFEHPLQSVALGVALLALAFVLTPYAYAYPFPYHSDIRGRLIAAAGPGLIIAGVAALLSVRSWVEPRPRQIAPAD